MSIKGIYLGAYQANHPNYDIVYQDINGKRDIPGDMLDVVLDQYDFVIATPPCNYWSRLNWHRHTSEYSLKTRHLLPCILLKLIHYGKPFIVENVRSDIMFNEWGLFNLPLYVYEVGRHTYWSNVFVPLDSEQVKDNIQYLSGNNRQGGTNVHNVIETWLKYVTESPELQTKSQSSIYGFTEES